LLQGPQAPPPDQTPVFNAQNQLKRPSGYEEWVMVGASTGLSYNPQINAQPGAGPGMFHQVYLQPWAYRHFKQTGQFPEGAMFVLAFYESVRDAAPAKQGYYPADPIASFEVHVKHKGLSESGWGFYGFDEGQEQAGMVPATAACYSCHASEAKTDNVFTQFYPAMRALLKRNER